MSSVPTNSTARLQIEMTPEERALISEAAEREHRSLSDFVLYAALRASEPYVPTSRLSDEEEAAIIQGAQSAFRGSSDYGRDLVEELFAERRAEAPRG